MFQKVKKPDKKPATSAAQSLGNKMSRIPTLDDTVKNIDEALDADASKSDVPEEQPSGRCGCF